MEDIIGKIGEIRAAVDDTIMPVYFPDSDHGSLIIWDTYREKGKVLAIEEPG